VKSSSLQITWKLTETSSAVDHYEVKLDDNAWTNIGTQTSYEFSGLIDGNHTFNIKSVGDNGLSQIYSITASVTNEVESGIPLMYLGVVVAIIAVSTIAILFYFKSAGRKSKLMESA